VFVRELIGGQEVDQPLLVRAAEVRTSREGGECLKLALGDRTGRLTAVIRENVDELKALCAVGSVVHVVGCHEVHPRYGPQLVVRSLRAAEPGAFAPADLVDGPALSPDRMEADLRDLVGTIQDPHLRALIDALLGEGTATSTGARRPPSCSTRPTCTACWSTR
jgi:3'-5' exoribonuclease